MPDLQWGAAAAQARARRLCIGVRLCVRARIRWIRFGSLSLSRRPGLVESGDRTATLLNIIPSPSPIPIPAYSVRDVLQVVRLVLVVPDEVLSVVRGGSRVFFGRMRENLDLNKDQKQERKIAKTIDLVGESLAGPLNN